MAARYVDRMAADVRLTPRSAGLLGVHDRRLRYVLDAREIEAGMERP